MAASDNQLPNRPSGGAGLCLAADALSERVEEEIGRAERHHTALSCLLVDVEDLSTIERTHGKELSEQALAYVGLALRREFRRFDRVGRPREREFLVVLPGADGARGEAVARRTLTRLRAIKIEARGERTPLLVSVGIATWREGLTAKQLIAAARAAVGRQPPEGSSLPPEGSSRPPEGSSLPPGGSSQPPEGSLPPGGSSQPLGGSSRPPEGSLPPDPLSFKDALRL